MTDLTPTRPNSRRPTPSPPQLPPPPPVVMMELRRLNSRMAQVLEALYDVRGIDRQPSDGSSPAASSTVAGAVQSSAADTHDMDTEPSVRSSPLPLEDDTLTTGIMSSTLAETTASPDASEDESTIQERPSTARTTSTPTGLSRIAAALPNNLTAVAAAAAAAKAEETPTGLRATTRVHRAPDRYTPDPI